MTIGGIPKFKERRGRTLEEYTGHSFSGLEISIELTKDNLYLGFKDPIHYREITGIYRKIKENPKSKDYLDVFTDSPQWFRIYEPDQGLADSIIKGVTGAKKKAEHENKRSDTEGICPKIKKAIVEKGDYKDGEYFLPESIWRKIKKKTGGNICNPDTRRGIPCHRRYENPFIVTDDCFVWISGKSPGENADIEVIPRPDVALCYLYQKIASDVHGHKDSTSFEIYATGDRNPRTFENLNAKMVMKIMTG